LKNEKEEAEKAERKKKMEEGWDIKKEAWDKDQQEIIDAALKLKESNEKEKKKHSDQKLNDLPFEGQRPVAGALTEKSKLKQKEGSVAVDSEGHDLKGGHEGPIAHVDEPGVGMVTTEEEEKSQQLVGHENGIVKEKQNKLPVEPQYKHAA